MAIIGRISSHYPDQSIMGNLRSLLKSESGSLENSQLVFEMAAIAEFSFPLAMVGVIFMFLCLLVVFVAGATFLTTRAFFDRAPPIGRVEAIKKSRTFCGGCQHSNCYDFLNILKAGSVDFPHTSGMSV